MRAPILASLLALWSQMACAADANSAANDFPLPPDTPVPALSAPNLHYDSDTTIERLAANPAAAAIVEKYIPGLLQDSSYPMFRGMSLKSVAALSRGEISAETIAAIAAELKSVPVSPPPQ